MIIINPNTLFIGQKVHYLDECASTNSFAQELIGKNNAIEGEIIICGTQLAGKGQQGNTWVSEGRKNLTFSVILSPKFIPSKEFFALNEVVSVAIFQTLQFFLPNKLVEIKWPNDILVSGQKICGVLIENIISHNEIKKSVVGLGLNVNQIVFNEFEVTSLCLQGHKESKLDDILKLLLENLERSYLRSKSGQHIEIQKIYGDNLFGLYQTLEFEDNEGPFNGEITGVKENGKLAISVIGKERAYAFKEVRFVR